MSFRYVLGQFAYPYPSIHVRCRKERRNRVILPEPIQEIDWQYKGT